MCWNKEISLNTFLFSLFSASLAYYNNVINIYGLLFLISFISMQLVEYFTWKYLNNKKINTLLSKIALFLIFIQPILSLQIYYGPKDKSLILKLQLIYIVFMTSVLSYYPIDFSMYREKNGHLAWNWLKFPFFVSVIWTAFQIGFFFYKKDYAIFFINFIIVAIVYYNYHKTNTWGSLWCWIANIISIGLLIEVFFGFRFSSNCLLSTSIKK
jgi:hypothetical protein